MSAVKHTNPIDQLRLLGYLRVIGLLSSTELDQFARKTAEGMQQMNSRSVILMRVLAAFGLFIYVVNWRSVRLNFARNIH